MIKFSRTEQRTDQSDFSRFHVLLSIIPPSPLLFFLFFEGNFCCWYEHFLLNFFLFFLYFLIANRYYIYIFKFSTFIAFLISENEFKRLRNLKFFLNFLTAKII